MTSVCQGLSSLAGGGEMRDPENEVGCRVNVLVTNNAYAYLVFPFTVSYIVLVVLYLS